MDEMNTSAVQTSETNNEASKPETKVTNTPKADDKPTKSVSIEEQLQQLLVENAKLKRASEKANSEAADYKKKYNATLSEQERASQ